MSEDLNALTMCQSDDSEVMAQMEEDEDEEIITLEDDAAIASEADEIYGRLYTLKEWIGIVKDYQEGLKTGDKEKMKEASTKVFEAMDPFIISVAYRFYPTYMKKYGDDIIQEGRAGLLDSMRTYDPLLSRPTNWFFNEIIHKMRDYIDEAIHHTTPYYQTRIRKIEKTIQYLKKEGRAVNKDTIQIETKYSRKTIDECYEIAKRNVDSISLNAPMMDGITTYGEVIASSVPQPDEIVLEQLKNESIRKEMLKNLPEEDVKIYAKYMGFDNPDGKPVSATRMENTYGVRKQEVSEVAHRSEETMRRVLGKDFKDEKKVRARRFDHIAGIVKSSQALDEERASLIFDEDAYYGELEPFDLVGTITSQDF